MGNSQTTGAAPKRRVTYAERGDAAYEAAVAPDDGRAPCKHADALFECAQHADAADFARLLRTCVVVDGGGGKAEEESASLEASEDSGDGSSSSGGAADGKREAGARARKQRRRKKRTNVTTLGTTESSRLLFWACGGGAGFSVMSRAYKPRERDEDAAGEPLSEDVRRARIASDLLRLCGVDPNCPCPEASVNPNGLRAVHLAAQLGHAELLRVLVKFGADTQGQPIIPNMGNNHAFGAGVIERDYKKRMKKIASFSWKDVDQFRGRSLVALEGFRGPFIFLGDRIPLRALAAVGCCRAADDEQGAQLQRFEDMFDMMDENPDVYGHPQQDELCYEFILRGMLSRNADNIAHLLDAAGPPGSVPRTELLTHPFVEFAFRLQFSDATTGYGQRDPFQGVFPDGGANAELAAMSFGETAASASGSASGESDDIQPDDWVGAGVQEAKLPEWMDALCSEGFNIDCVDEKGESPLFYRVRQLAARYGYSAQRTNHPYDPALMALTLAGANFRLENKRKETVFDVLRQPSDNGGMYGHGGLSKADQKLFRKDLKELAELSPTGSKTKSAAKR